MADIPIMHQLNAHEKPPNDLRAIFKKYQTMPLDSFTTDPGIVDFSREIGQTHNDSIRIIRIISFPNSNFHSNGPTSCTTSTAVFEYRGLEGLEILPGLLSQDIQTTILCKLLHRDLADPRHKTNVHTHYHVPYDLARSNMAGANVGKDAEIMEDGTSFFNCDPKCAQIFRPISPGEHRSFTITQFLGKKLRWMTLGGQYDWTRKVYPVEPPPAFPEDIGSLVRQMFPEMEPEAAIVNIYSPGDTLSLHRDVSEESDHGLVSISFGCDGLFVVGMRDEAAGSLRCIVIRLRSGDAIYMSGKSRYAWHGVPRIIPNTCPDWLRSWPASVDKPEVTGDIGEASSSAFNAWRGWMSNKRINLNVRQMKN